MTDKIVEEARKWLDVPWKHQGRSRNGIDCVGLLVAVGVELGYFTRDYDYTNYPRRSAHSRDFIAIFDDLAAKGVLHKKRVFDFQPGDIALLKEPIFPCHCGIIGSKYGKTSLIHGHAKRRKVVEDLYYESGWNKLHVATYGFGEG